MNKIQGQLNRESSTTTITKEIAVFISIRANFVPITEKGVRNTMAIWQLMKNSYLHAVLKKCMGAFIIFPLKNESSKTNKSLNPYFKEMKRNGLKSTQFFEKKKEYE